MKLNGSKLPERRREPLTDTQLLMTITVCIFVGMYILAMLIWGGGFRKPQMLFDILNDNAFLTSGLCGVKRKINRVARTGIYSSHRIDEYQHGVWHMEIERERTVFLEFDGDGFLLSHNVVTHDDIDAVVQSFQLC